jgi:hypothetical protein
MEGRSNVTFESFRQLKKHDSEIVSTEEGIQIDRSDEHAANAYLPRVEILELDANLTEQTESQALNDPAATDPMSPQIVTSASFPK